MRHHVTGQRIHRARMPKESGLHAEYAIEKLGQFCGIKIARPQPLEQRPGRFQFMSFQIFRHVCCQRAVGAIQKNAALALDEQAQFRQFVLENSDAGGKSMHNSFPQRRGSLSRRLGEERSSILNSQF